MKVLTVNVDYKHGGASGIARAVALQIRDEGYESIFAYGRGNAPDELGSIKIGSKIGVYTHTLISRFCDNEGRLSSHATRGLIKDIERIKPDIVQIHNLVGHYINYPMLFEYLKKSGIPTVWTLHDTWALTGHCINFERVKCEKWKKECHSCPLQKDYPYSYILDRSKKNFGVKMRSYSGMDNLHIVTPSQWLCGIAEQSQLLKGVDKRVIYNGIDLDMFRRTESDLRRRYGLEGKTVLMFSTFHWSEMKGYNIVCRLAELLPEKYAIVMIGIKDEEHLPKRIISIPFIKDPRELAKWYSTADIYVNPTLGDNFPTVNIEALACGTPVVTCNTGGSPEVAGNEFGRVVYSKTAEEFVEKIAECENAGIEPEKCRERALMFDKKTAFAKYTEFYRELLEK